MLMFIQKTVAFAILLACIAGMAVLAFYMIHFLAILFVVGITGIVIWNLVKAIFPSIVRNATNQAPVVAKPADEDKFLAVDFEAMAERNAKMREQKALLEKYLAEIETQQANAAAEVIEDDTLASTEPEVVQPGYEAHLKISKLLNLKPQTPEQWGQTCLEADQLPGTLGMPDGTDWVPEPSNRSTEGKPKDR